MRVAGTAVSSEECWGDYETTNERVNIRLALKLYFKMHIRLNHWRCLRFC